MRELQAAKELVAGRGWLSEVPNQFRQAVLDRVMLQKYSLGQSVYRVGDPPGGSYGLVSGGIRVTIAPGEQGPYFAHFLRPGAWVGETSAISAQPRLVGLSASRETVLLHLPLQAINEILHADPWNLRYFALCTQRHLDTAIGAIADLMLRDQNQRFVALLLRLGGCRYMTPPGGVIEIDLSQEDLAAMANVARSTANAILGRLQESGHLDRTYRRIVLREPDKMRHFLTE